MSNKKKMIPSLYFYSLSISSPLSLLFLSQKKRKEKGSSKIVPKIVIQISLP
jgi:hypothetical protein